jgi:hypothetical protein
MQHTYTHQAVLDKEIDESYEEALTLTQGHSRQITNDYYILKNMINVANTASVAHKRLHGEFTVPNIPTCNKDDEEFHPPDVTGTVY